MSFVQEIIEERKAISSVQREVIRTLLYYAIFHHPLSEKEIFENIQNKSFSKKEINFALSELRKDEIIQHHDEFYFIGQNSAVVERRKQGELAAASALKIARRFSKIISSFPFVRCIALSGSLSKNFMDIKSDIDYFVITEPGKMWLSRTLLVLFKKIFLLNSRKYFCVNYFLTTDNLEVPDKNIFTATEIVSVIPTFNYSLYLEFISKNVWVKDFLPNYPLRNSEQVVLKKDSKFKKNIENIFSGKTGEALDNFCFRLTLRFWKKKFKHFDDTTFDFRLRSRKNESKHHPQGFQEKVLKLYRENISAFEQDHNIALNEENPVYA